MLGWFRFLSLITFLSAVACRPSEPAQQVGEEAAVLLPCVPNCGSRECGDDGCGSLCGLCFGHERCAAGRCQLACEHGCETYGETLCSSDDRGLTLCGGREEDLCHRRSSRILCDAGRRCEAGACVGDCVVPEVWLIVDRRAVEGAVAWPVIKAVLADWARLFAPLARLGVRIVPGVDCQALDPASGPLDALEEMLDLGEAQGGTAPLYAGLESIEHGLRGETEGRLVILISPGGPRCKEAGLAEGRLRALLGQGIRTAVIATGPSWADLAPLAALGGLPASQESAIWRVGDGEELQAVLHAIMARMDVCCADPDRDGAGPGCAQAEDPCPLVAPEDDVDGDCIADPEDPCPGLSAREDQDGDCLADAEDPCPRTHGDQDADGDCWSDDEDPCPQDPDNDLDGDGACADEDPCPLVAHADDSDDDCLADADDVCPEDPSNPDPDGDGLCSDVDPCPTVPAFSLEGADCTRELAILAPGEFQMGSPLEELGRSGDETQHPVTISRPFAMRRTEVTQAEWEEVMGVNPSGHGGCPRCPVENLNWYEAVSFCNALSELEGLTPCYELVGCRPEAEFGLRCVAVDWPLGLDCTGYRLATEAEWEYAARAGTVTAFASGEIREIGCGVLDPALDELGWYCANANTDGRGLVPHEVGTKAPNPWGLYDMHGNVFEWVWDAYQEDYALLADTDPIGALEAPSRSGRGGAFARDASEARAAAREGGPPQYRDSRIGLRVARSVEP